MQHKEGAQQQHENDEPCERIITHIGYSSADCHLFPMSMEEQDNFWSVKPSDSAGLSLPAALAGRRLHNRI